MENFKEIIITIKPEYNFFIEFIHPKTLLYYIFWLAGGVFSASMIAGLCERVLTGNPASLFLLYALMIVLPIALTLTVPQIACFKYCQYTYYKIDNKSIKIENGNPTSPEEICINNEEIEAIEIEKSIMQKIFNLGTIIIYRKEFKKNEGKVVFLKNIKSPDEIYELLKSRINSFM